MTMKFGVFLFLLGVARDVSPAPYPPGPGPDCSISSAPQCYFKLEGVGCYKDKTHERALPDLLLTARDASSSVYFGEPIDWQDWASFIDRFTCACAEKAKKNYYDYFGIEFYGECWGGMNADYGVHGPSGKCEMIKEDECTFEACDEQLNGPRQCVGGPLALYVYRIKQKPPPTQLPPPPPPPTTKPPPPHPPPPPQ